MIRGGIALAGKWVQAGQRLAGGVRTQVRRWRRKPQRVLLLKTWNDRLGDLILITGTLRHYRRLYVGCRLELACPDPYVELFQDCPHLDAVVPLSTYFQSVMGKSRPSVLNAGRYDRVISLRRPPRLQDYQLVASFLPSWTAGITGDRLLIDVPTAARHEAQLDCAVPVSVRDTPEHELDMQVALLRAQGMVVQAIDELWPEFWTRSDDGRLLDAQMHSETSGHPIIVFSPCGNASIRDWNPSGFLQVFEALAPCTLVLTGKQRDAHFISGMDLHELQGVRLINLIGQTSINEMVETVRRADLVIGVESAIFHVAVAMRKPVVCIAGGGHWGRFAPWGIKDRTRVLTHRLGCFGCGWKCYRTAVECIQRVTAEEVIRNARDLLSVKL